MESLWWLWPQTIFLRPWTLCLLDVRGRDHLASPGIGNTGLGFVNDTGASIRMPSWHHSICQVSSWHTRRSQEPGKDPSPPPAFVSTKLLPGLERLQKAWRVLQRPGLRRQREEEECHPVSPGRSPHLPREEWEDLMATISRAAINPFTATPLRSRFGPFER